MIYYNKINIFVTPKIAFLNIILVECIDIQIINPKRNFGTVPQQG